jgi:cell wall assembly regulator SMI1
MRVDRTPNSTRAPRSGEGITAIASSRREPADVSRTWQNMTRLLDDELLDRFDRVLAAQPGDLLGLVGPGPSERVLRTALDGLPMAPTNEVVRWLGRHRWDGAFVLPGLEALDVRSVVEGYHLMRELAVEAAHQGQPVRPGADARLANPDHWWSPHWLMVLSLGGSYKLAIDCAGAPDGPSPVRMIAWDGPDEPDYAAAFSPSLGQYIEDACRVLEDGRYRYDPSRETWLPMDWATRPIVELFSS